LFPDAVMRLRTDTSGIRPPIGWSPSVLWVQLPSAWSRVRP